jgi:hypothetical protein
LLKDTSPEDLVSAIKKASRGETVLGSPVASRLVAEPEVLSGREIEVTELVGRGATNAEIAVAHKRGDGQEQRLEDTAQARPRGPRPTGAVRREALAGGAVLKASAACLRRYTNSEWTLSMV